MKYRYGDIIWVDPQLRRAEKLKHPAVVWQKEYNGIHDFLGIMLTHSEPSDKFKNILLLQSHIKEGNVFKWDKTHFVNQLFNKFSDWGPFYKVGELTEDGLEFIKIRLTKIDPMEYSIYNQKLSQD